jgi:hypothetical protein
MRTTAIILAALLAACGSTGSVPVTTPDAGPDVSAPSGEWVWQSDVPATGQLEAVWASGPGDAWAGGDDGLMLHWNGVAWAQVDPATTNHIHSIWGSGPDDVWAACGGLAGPNTATLVHWDGNAWSPVDPGTAMNLDGVWGSGPTDVYAAGHSGVAGTVQHFDGQTWSTVFTSDEMAPAAVSGSSASDVWLVGQDIYPAFGDHFVQHASSGAFAPVASGATQSLSSVWSAGPGDAWAKGIGGLFHWDGAAWSAVSTTLGLAYGNVWGLASSAVFAVGDDQRIDEWNGKAWTTVHDDAVGAGLVAVGGSDATHLFAVGENTTILRFDTALSGEPTCADVRGQCGDASACGVGQGHTSDYACSGSSVCCVAQAACGGFEAECCVNGSDPGPRAVCHNGAFYCPAGSQPCPQHP